MKKSKLIRTVCIAVTVSILTGMIPITTNAYSSVSQMLSRTENIDHSWQDVNAGQVINIIGNSSVQGLDTQVNPKPEDANQASTHASQNTAATPGTLWLNNINTWAFGYTIEVKGIPEGESVTASVKSNSWGHDCMGQQGGGWNVEYTQSFTFTHDGVYTMLINGYQTQNKIMRPQRKYLLWVRQYDVSFNKDVSMRVLAELEAVSDSKSNTEADFTSKSEIKYHNRDGSVAATKLYNAHEGFDYATGTTPVIETPLLDHTLESYTEGGIEYQHIGWSTVANAYKPDVKHVYGNMDVYPVFEATGVPFATFYSEDGKTEYGRQPIIPGKPLTTDIVPEKDLGDEYDYTFDYWVDKDGNKVELSTVTDEIQLFAHFSRELKSKTVSVYSEDGKELIGTYTVKYGSPVEGLTPPVKKNESIRAYTFDKWVTLDEGKDADISSITEDISIRPVYTVDFVNVYEDVPDDEWYYRAVKFVSLNNIMFGTEDTKFSPDETTTRAMFVAVLYRIEGSRDVSSLNPIPFTDVPKDSYYYKAVVWAHNFGVVAGTSDTTFSPDDLITREQMSAMLYRYAKNIRYYDMSIDENTTFDNFTDGQDVSDYAREAMLWMVQDSRKYIMGQPDGEGTAICPLEGSTRAMMAEVLYRFTREGEGLAEEFANPSKEFSPTPFWFWNDNLTEEEISRQMRAFKEKGIDSFVIHPRMGLTTNIVYMEESWMHYVRYAVELAKELDMRVVLYDEAMYPSGSCHGQVVAENPEYASKGIKITESPALGNEEKLIASFDKNGKTYYVVEAFSYGRIRGVYSGEDDGQANAPRSADLLNPDAVATFIRLTHEKYYNELGEFFGNTIFAIFTDEPSLLGRFNKGNLLAWTDDLLEDCKKAGMTDEDLYYLFYDKNSSRGREVNEIYNQVVYDRLKVAYYRQIATWCQEHNIALTGHPSSSMDIGLLSEFQIPCQDVVWRYIAPGNVGVTEAGNGHETMGKCASDSARHTGKRRNGNECFGACSLPSDPHRFTVNDAKWYLDWLFSRGCNFIIPHAFYYSVTGNRGNERPPQVGMNGSFWEEYTWLSKYIKRCSAMNTDSVNITDIAVLCTKNYLPNAAVNPMFENQIEFNYLEDTLLKQATVKNGKIKIAKQSYSVVVTDRQYDDEVKAILDEFTKGGGKVISYSQYAGKINAYVSLLKESSFTDLNIIGDKMLRMTHVRKYGKDIVFLSNEGENTISATVNEKVDEVWNAKTGNMMKNYSGDSYQVTLKPRETVYLILK